MIRKRLTILVTLAAIADAFSFYYLARAAGFVTLVLFIPLLVVGIAAATGLLRPRQAQFSMVEKMVALILAVEIFYALYLLAHG